MFTSCYVQLIRMPLPYLRAFPKLLREALGQKDRLDLKKIERYQQESREIILEMMEIAGVEA